MRHNFATVLLCKFKLWISSFTRLGSFIRIRSLVPTEQLYWLLNLKVCSLDFFERRIAKFLSTYLLLRFTARPVANHRRLTRSNRPYLFHAWNQQIRVLFFNNIKYSTLASYFSNGNAPSVSLVHIWIYRSFLNIFYNLISIGLINCDILIILLHFLRSLTKSTLCTSVRLATYLRRFVKIFTRSTTHLSRLCDNFAVSATYLFLLCDLWFAADFSRFVVVV